MGLRIGFESSDLGQVPDLPCTAPGPKLGRFRKPRLNGIPLNVTRYSAKLGGIPNPVIIGFVLPEAGSPSFQNLVGKPGAAFLHSTCDRRERRMRLDQDMHMIRHQNPGDQVIQLPDVLATIESLHNCFRQPNICKPHRSGRCPVQNPICRRESLPGTSRPHKHPFRQTPVQSPRQKNCGPIGVPVRQTTLIDLHTSLQCAQLRNFSLGRSGTCPTFLWDRGGYA